MRTTGLRRFLVGTGLVACTSGLLPAVTAEAAVVTAHITGVVKLRVTDHENFIADKVCHATETVDFFWSSNDGTKKRSAVAYCGGEVRVEVDHFYTVNSSGTVNVHAFGRLYEGGSHDTTDLDGKDERKFSVPKGPGVDVSFLALHNSDEGGDSSFVDFVLERDVV
ncbi:hypothetical protein ACFYOT_33335 [Saccharothrix saharensis]|uniref:hypothetical protein n=1 Tax=Saccharothrix saharensis TaxID=571190 RepID=UPI0036755911